MRDAILSAVSSGRIEDLRTALELNEMKPEIAGTPVADPIAHWKAASADGEGRSVLAVLANVLAMPFATVPLGRDLENNRVYVWPYLAELPAAKLGPADEVQLLRLATTGELDAMKARGTYAGWRLAIGADGVWHSFRKVE